MSTELNPKHEAILRKAAAAIRARGHDRDARLADSVEGIITSLARRASPAAAVPVDALPPLPKPWEERIGAPYKGKSINDIPLTAQIHHMQAEIFEWRARAAVEADRARQQQTWRDSALRAEPARQRIAELERAADYLEQYAKYCYEVKPEDIERHPYIPSIEESAENLRTMIAEFDIEEASRFRARRCLRAEQADRILLSVADLKDDEIQALCFRVVTSAFIADDGDVDYLRYDAAVVRAVVTELATRCRAEGGDGADRTTTNSVVVGADRAQRPTIKDSLTVEADRAQQGEPVGWVYGNSYWERGNPRLTDRIKKFGQPRYAAPAPDTGIPTAGEVEKAGWISVDNARKPEAGVTVLLYVRTMKHGLDDDLRPFHTEDAQVEMGEYRKGESAEMSYFDCYASPISDNDWITHWMPLPAGPSEAKAGDQP